MRLLINILLGLICFTFLTVLTQVGGVIFLISIFTFKLIDKRLNSWWTRLPVKILSFVILYLIFVFVIVPPAAKRFGRVPMPLVESNHVRPANILTVLLNRNYVRPELRQATFDVARKMNDKYPGS